MGTYYQLDIKFTKKKILRETLINVKQKHKPLNVLKSILFEMFIGLRCFVK